MQLFNTGREKMQEGIYLILYKHSRRSIRLVWEYLSAPRRRGICPKRGDQFRYFRCSIKIRYYWSTEV